MAHPRPLDLRGTVLALVLAAIWSANPLAVKVGLADAPPFRLAWMRFLLGGLAILAYAWWTRHRGVFDVHPGEWRVLWSLGLLFAVQIGLMNVGIARTTATHAAVLVNSYAVHTVVLAHFFIPGDRLTVPKLGGIAIAYLGIVLLFARDFSFQSGTLVGDLIVSASALLLGERIVYMARAVQRLDPIKMLVFQAAIGSACFFLVSTWWEAGEPTRYTAPLGRVAPLSGGRGRRVQLRDEHAPLADLPAERARHLRAHDADLRRARLGRHRGRGAHADAAPLGPHGGGGHRPGYAAVKAERA